jgi:hypothetical protein
MQSELFRKRSHSHNRKTSWSLRAISRVSWCGGICKCGVTGSSTLIGGDWYASCSSCFTSEERAPSCAAGGSWMHPIAHTLYSVFSCSICSWKVAVTNRRTDRFSRTQLSTAEDCFNVLLQSPHWVFWGWMHQHQIVKILHACRSKTV